MKRMIFTLALAFAPVMASAGDLVVAEPYVPAPPPGTMAHAAYMTVTNSGSEVRNLIGVKADGYKMAHLHQSMEHDGVMMMHAVDQLELAPGQSVELAPGGLHIMLMKPKAMVAEGDEVSLMLEFANGEMLPVTAIVRKPDGSS